MSLGTIILMFLLPILVSAIPIWPQGRSALYLEKFERKRSWVMYLVNKRFLTVVLWSFVLLLTSCQQDGIVERTGEKVDKSVEQAGKHIEKTGEAPGNKGEGAAVALDDSAITAKIKGEFSSDPLLKIAQLEVTTTGGVVKLSGFVNSQKSIDRAQDIARSIKEVKSIESSLLIKGY